MNKSMLVGAVLGAVGVTAGGAVATYSLVDRGPDYAEVLAVTPVNETVKTPREECKDVTVTRQRPVQDQHQIAGTAIGAIAGGLLGNQVGGGTGKKIASGLAVTCAGKTGTAEIGKGEMRRKNTWVIAFAPFEKPTVAIAMVVERGESGGKTVAPRVNAVFSRIFGRKEGEQRL